MRMGIVPSEEHNKPATNLAHIQFDYESFTEFCLSADMNGCVACPAIVGYLHNHDHGTSTE